MLNIKSPVALTSAGLLSAMAASLCCITPVVALVAGSSLAANFSWLEPVRPFLVGLSIGVLALAWYIQLKPHRKINKDCCETTKDSSFLQSKTFLGIVTLFAFLMMTFPLYANLYYPKAKTLVSTIIQTNKTQQVKYTIQGMTCAGCEVHVNKELLKENGVLAYTTSYTSRSSLVSFDYSKTSIKALEAAINRSGYKVKSYERFPASNKADSLPTSFGTSSKNKVKFCCEKVQ
jgi:copper chaperone CopZ